MNMVIIRPQYSVKARMSVRLYGNNLLDRDIVRKQSVEASLVYGPLSMVYGRHIKVRKILFSMYAGIGAATTNRFYRLAQKCRQCFVDYCLYAYRILLYLPAVVFGTIVCKFKKIALSI